MTAREVYDRKATHAKRDLAFYESPLIIRSSVLNGAAHPVKDRSAVFVNCLTLADEACNATHSFVLPVIAPYETKIVIRPIDSRPQLLVPPGHSFERLMGKLLPA